MRLLIGFLLNLLLVTAANAELEIVRITPSGDEVRQQRQIVLSFNQTMAKLGDMARAAETVPVNIEPKVDCEWRWLDENNLACELAPQAALKKATSYHLSIPAGWKSLSGDTLATAVNHRFTTVRPKVYSAYFDTWEAPGTPVLKVRFNQPVTQRSVSEHLYFTTETEERRSVTVFQKAIVEESAEPKAITLADKVKAWVERWFAPKVEPAPTAPPPPAEPEQVWLVKPSLELPQDSQVRLHVEPGLVAAAGPMSGLEAEILQEFDTFPEFEFLGVRCIDNKERELMLNESESTRRCNPQRSIQVRFSSPVMSSSLADNLRIVPSLNRSHPDFDPWANYYDYSRLGRAHHQGDEYSYTLPSYFKPFAEYHLSNLAKLRDEFGRPLQNAFKLSFLTAHLLPDYHLQHQFSVLEKDVASDAQVRVTNLDKLTAHYDKLTADNRWRSLKHKIKLHSAVDVVGQQDLEVRRMLRNESGIVTGRLSSEPAVKHHGDGNWFFAQVTPWQVHAKLGHYNTLVWVSNLADGSAVTDAKVELIQSSYDDFARKPNLKDSAKTNPQGIARLHGLKMLDPKLDLQYAWKRDEPRLMVKVTKGDDIALLPLDYEFVLDLYQVSDGNLYSSREPLHGHLHSWGFTGQGVYRAGDKIDYKVYLRDQNNRRYTHAPRSSYELEVIDPQGKVVHKVANLRLSDYGSYDGQFTTAKTAAVGWYQFRLTSSFSTQRWTPMRVLVSDFTASPFKVSATVAGERFVPGNVLRISSQAQLHAGGPYIDAAAELSVNLKPKPLNFSDSAWEAYHFGENADAAYETTLHRSEHQTNQDGEVKTHFTLPDSDILHGRLSAESSIQDDSGRRLSAFANADFFGRDRFVGIQQSDWVLKSGEDTEFTAVVLTPAGESIPGVAVEMTVERLETVAAKVKSAGNSYTSRYESRWIQEHHCNRQSRKDQAVDCLFTPRKAGVYRLGAKITDSRQRQHVSYLTRWVSGSESVLWEESDDYRLQIEPEKTTYQPGETARYLVKNPFPGSKALVSVERYGVLKHWIQEFTTSTPIIEFPVEEDFAPGFYLSVAVISPRVADAPVQGSVDLGKPALRLGYVQTQVERAADHIQLQISQADSYRPGDEVSLEIKAELNNPENPESFEVALVVIDEAVLDLIQQGKGYFDPRKGFNRLDGLDVENFSLLTQLVGRQNIEKKGANAGGGGGADGPQLRSVFKHVALWEPRLRFKHGETHRIRFTAPDNLTGWRVLAVAMSPTYRMGLGESHFKVNRPTELRPVMPNQLSLGDVSETGFSVMNRTDETRQLQVDINAIQNQTVIQEPVNTSQLLKPYERKTLAMTVTAEQAGDIHFIAKAGDANDQDALQHTLRVVDPEPFIYASSFGSTTLEDNERRIPLELPADHRDAQLEIALSNSLLGQLDDSLRYLRDYPHTCWEQRLSRALGAAYLQKLQQQNLSDLSWDDHASLPQAVLNLAQEFQAPNGGMSYFTAQDRYVSPFLSAYTAFAFNELASLGYEIPVTIEQPLHRYLQKLLRNKIAGYSESLSYTTRSLALAALAPHGEVKIGEVSRLLTHKDKLSQFGKAMLLEAAVTLKHKRGKKVLREDFLGQLQQSAGTAQIGAEAFPSLHGSAMRNQCSALRSFSSLANSSRTQRKLIGDLPEKMARSINQSRQAGQGWYNTQENVFCLSALNHYAAQFESDSLSIPVQIDLQQEPQAMPLQSWDSELTTEQRQVNFSQPLDKEFKTAELVINRLGEGRLYDHTQIRFRSPSLSQKTNAGFVISREYRLREGDDWRLLNDKETLESGQQLRVDLFISNPAERYFVAVTDPVSGAFEPLNPELIQGDADALKLTPVQPAADNPLAKIEHWTDFNAHYSGFYHQEIGFESVRFYADQLPKGDYRLSYAAQVLTPGRYYAAPGKVEAMYDPDVFGLSNSRHFKIEK